MRLSEPNVEDHYRASVNTSGPVSGVVSRTAHARSISHINPF